MDNYLSKILYVIPTPIGNLKDITLRALEVLKSVDLIIAEDTRSSKKLLSHYKINAPIKSYHMHNEHTKLNFFIDKLLDGKKIGLISDAGTPSISDPGFLLIREAIKNKIKVECLPGATALIPAIVSSGLSSDRFIFEGFQSAEHGIPFEFMFSPHKANGVQLLFPEWNQFSSAFDSLLLTHPSCQVPQHWFAICEYHLSLVLCLVTFRPPPLLVFEPFQSTEHGMPLVFILIPHEANRVQLPFPLVKQFPLEFVLSLIVHPLSQVPQHNGVICHSYISLVLFPSISRPPPFLYEKELYRLKHDLPIVDVIIIKFIIRIIWDE